MFGRGKQSETIQGGSEPESQARDGKPEKENNSFVPILSCGSPLAWGSAAWAGNICHLQRRRARAADMCGVQRKRHVNDVHLIRHLSGRAMQFSSTIMRQLFILGRIKKGLSLSSAESDTPRHVDNHPRHHR
jgi:hypothetical protein